MADSREGQYQLTKISAGHIFTATLDTSGRCLLCRGRARWRIDAAPVHAPENSTERGTYCETDAHSLYADVFRGGGE